jgi:predicted glycoside hydrolase/deacetylase ChbG (UPF0249 family)
VLIVTADDYGRERNATDAILLCGSMGRISSASAMVFMRDSERAATLARDSALEFGLHLNLSEPFDGANVSTRLQLHFDRVRRFVTLHKFAPVVYHPGLRQSFKIVCEAQRDEFERRYQAPPSFYNGHHHLHLCANVLLDGLIPPSSRIRTTFTFEPGERGMFNRVYRGMLRRWVAARYITTDSFFSIEPIHDVSRVRLLVRRSHDEAVEIETHPATQAEATFLAGDAYRDLLAGAELGAFGTLRSAAHVSSRNG